MELYVDYIKSIVISRKI